MKKFKIRLLSVAVVLAIASMAASALIIYNMLEKSGNPLLTNQPDITLPNFVGLTEEEVKAENDFAFEVEYVYNSEYEEGVVVSQKPKAPRSVKQNSVVKLKVSKGVLSGELPDLTMYTQTQAQEKLEELEVHVYIKKVEKRDMPEGVVVNMEPQAGQTVNAGDTVILYVSTAEKVTAAIVPNVVGKDISEARRLIIGARLKINLINVQSEEPVGTVIWQNHGAGAQLPQGTPLEIHVSAGQ